MSTTEDSIEKKIEDLAKMLIYEGAKSARTDKYPKKALAKALSELSLLMGEANDTSKVDRFEVIDHRTKLGGEISGRILVIDPRSPQEYPTKVEISYQDDGKTLKVFLSDRESK